MRYLILSLFLTLLLLTSCSKVQEKEQAFPSELVDFEPVKDMNPVFYGTGDSLTWDEQIRERGYIIRENNTWYLWYTGYTKKTGKTMKYLGLATSSDGYAWHRDDRNPLKTDLWIEDLQVLKEDSSYYMFAESKDDLAHILISTDKIHWEDLGEIAIQKKNGEPIEKGPYGTPTVWKENGTWYLFYERNDAAIWLATSTDLKLFTNVQDDPVITCGPEGYDKYAVAMNQIVKHDNKYYAYYHASAYEDWRTWTNNIAVSEDLIHWQKYSKNPITTDGSSSGIMVNDGTQNRFYSMHPQVSVYLPTKR
tara:strand:- start:723 stop:1643 length:921 start_codon:yes stop_codon:yes gene_type:complete